MALQLAGAGGGGGVGEGAGVGRRRRARRGKCRRRGQVRRRAAAELAPYNSNQFLMEEHMPEPRRSRTRDSSFSVDSEDNYFFPLPEDEEDFITKEFSSVYEDAQSERLADMSKSELIQEYLLLQARCEALTKRCLAPRPDAASVEATVRLKEQEELIEVLRSDNQSLKLQIEQAKRTQSSTSNADSESDSSSSSCTDGTGSTLSPATNGMDDSPSPLTNGFADRPPEDPPVNGNGEGDHSIEM